MDDDLIRDAAKQYRLFERECASRGLDPHKEMMKRVTSFENTCAEHGVDPSRTALALARADRGCCICCGARLPKGVDPFEAYAEVFGDE